MRMHPRLTTVACVLLCLLTLFPTGAAPASAAPSFSDGVLLARLQQATGGRARVERHAATGRLRLMETPQGAAVPRMPGIGVAASPEMAARAFLREYGPLFGVDDPSAELRIMGQSQQGGATFVRLQQQHADVPVLGGELVVQVNSGRGVVSVNGEFVPGLQQRAAPTLTAAEATRSAVDAVAKNYGVEAATLRATAPELWFYNPVLLGGPGLNQTVLTWRLEIANGSQETPVRELVLVDARTGIVALHFNQIADALIRHICNANGVVDADGNPDNNCDDAGERVRSEGGPATGIADVDLAYDYSGDTYDYYFNNFGRDSLNNAGMPLVSLVKYCPPGAGNCPYENAFWDGVQMTYGAGYASADDVVGHELSHGVTEFSSHLFYYYQSGAINEAMSDIFGELIDLQNGAGTDTPAVRWLVGEDLPIGAIRNMADPTAIGDPDRTASPLYYGGELDSGGVHFNSGVANKAAFLMADGGTFNAFTITGLGLDKTGQIFYLANNSLLTSASDYQDLGAALQLACASLTGTHGITAADCAEVTKVVFATEMDTPPTNAAAVDAVACAAGQTVNDTFYDDLENTASGIWASRAITGTNGWYYPANPNPVIDAQYATSGTKNFWGYDVTGISDYVMEMQNDVTIPAGGLLHFRHSYDFDGETTRWDGGVVEYSTNGGTSWTDAGSLFVANGYNGTIRPNGNSNPLSNRQAFTLASKGYIASRADLGSLAGQSVRFRFRIGTDASVDDYGWFIDDVRVYTCGGVAVNTAPKISTQLNVTLRRDGPAISTTVGTVTDIEDAPGSLAVDVVSAPEGMDIVARNTGGQVGVSINSDCTTPPGTYDITLMVTDSQGATDISAISITVLPDDPQLLADPSFEAGSPNSVWDETSINYGTPLCTVGLCGTGNGVAGPRTGSWWAWFGGVANEAEIATMSQTINMPSGSTTLQFYLWIGTHNGEGNNAYLKVYLDDTAVFTATDSSTAYNAGYTLVSVDVSAFTGAQRELRFESKNGARTTPFNVSVDDVTLVSSTTICTVTPEAAFSAEGQEIDEAGGSVTLEVALSEPRGYTTQIPVTLGGTATAADYTLSSSTITIPAKELTGTVTLNVVDDGLDEDDQTVVVTLGAPGGATLASPSVQTVTIRDNDAAPSVAWGAASSSAAERDGTVPLAITLSAPSELMATVEFSLGGTATNGVDYTVTPSPLVFAPGETSKTVAVTLLRDALAEDAETITLTLNSAEHATIGGVSQYILTVSNTVGFDTYLPLLVR